jgi:hypothetical protein
MGTDSGIGIVSQNFESSFDIYDSLVADDIKVPKLHKWIVDELDVVGTYFNGAGPANSENVTVYKDANGLPGALVADFPAVAGIDSGTGSFTFKHMGQQLKLKGGLKGARYWIGVQANMDFAVGGEWGWENETTVRGYPSVWENPGDGFATGCTTWTDEATCIPDGQGDQMFAVQGRSGVSP